MKASSVRLFTAALCFVGLSLSGSPRSLAQTNTFTATGSMITTRYEDTATTLQNGMVLIAGGYQVSSAELYNPTTGASSITGAMHSNRWGHTATLLKNGMVLIAGGCTGNGTCLASAELYNPANGTFTVTGSMSTQRDDFTAVLLQSGKVLVAGGCNGSNGCDATTELYNPATGTFTLTGSMSTKRWGHVAALLNNGMVLEAGGCTGGGTCLASAELYNPLTGTFTVTGGMSTQRDDFTATMLQSGKVLVAGGCNGSNGCDATTELYNPTTGTFALSGSMSTKRWGHTATGLQDGTVLITGGCTGGGTCLSSAELYNPMTGTFTVTGAMNEPRDEQTAALLQNGTVLISGGCNGSNGCFSSEQVFHPEPPTVGFVNPKYVIVAVVYSPPGAQSSVTYANNTVVGNSTSLMSTFASQVSQSIALTGGASGSTGTGANIFGFSTSETVTSSSAYTQEEDTSSSVAISETTSQSTTVNGNTVPAGVDHDFDYIFIWLNPILNYSVYTNSPNTLTWGGYGFDLNDVPTIDILGLQVGWLNGTIPMPSNIPPILARAWAAGQDWPAGQGPGITSADLASILAADPFSNASYVVTPNVATTADGRFTATGDPTIDYEPEVKDTYSDGYTITATQSQTAKYTYTQGFAVEQQFKATFFMNTFMADLKNSNMLTWTNQFNQSTNNSQGQTASLSITGPPSTYTGPPQFVVYQDNVYGTFLFYPKAQ
jgi:hypothetical protein